MTPVKIKGMSCQHCVQSVAEALEKLDGVQSVVVDLDKGEAQIEGAADPAAIKAAIDKIGFEVVE
jgi:copper chaperone